MPVVGGNPALGLPAFKVGDTVTVTQTELMSAVLMRQKALPGGVAAANLASSWWNWVTALGSVGCSLSQQQGTIRRAQGLSNSFPILGGIQALGDGISAAVDAGLSLLDPSCNAGTAPLKTQSPGQASLNLPQLAEIAADTDAILAEFPIPPPDLSAITSQLGTMSTLLLDIDTMQDAQLHHFSAFCQDNPLFLCWIAAQELNYPESQNQAPWNGIDVVTLATRAAGQDTLSWLNQNGGLNGSMWQLDRNGACYISWNSSVGVFSGGLIYPWDVWLGAQGKPLGASALYSYVKNPLVWVNQLPTSGEDGIIATLELPDGTYGGTLLAWFQSLVPSWSWTSFSRGDFVTGAASGGTGLVVGIPRFAWEADFAGHYRYDPSSGPPSRSTMGDLIKQFSLVPIQFT